MPRLTAEQLAMRAESIGSSDVPAILGLLPNRGPMDVWLEKTGMAEHSRKATADTEAGEWGHRLEPIVAAAYADQMNRDLNLQWGTHGKEWLRVEPVEDTFRWKGHPYSATLDYRANCLGPGEEAELETWPVEIKTRAPWKAKDWGEAGTDQVPADIYAQVQWQMFVTQAQRADVAVLFGNFDFRIYALTRNDVWLAQALKAIDAFWLLVLKQEPPELDGSEASAEYLKQQFPRAESDTVVEIDDPDSAIVALMRQVAAAQDIVAGQQAIVDEGKNRLKLEIGDRKGLVTPVGKALWNNVKGRTTTNWEALARELLAASSAEVQQQLIARHTTTGAGSRQFRLTFKEE